MLRFTTITFGLILFCYCLEAFSEENHRQKRYLPLVFPLGGTYKIIFGWAIPIKNPANVSLTFGLNMQWQYSVPTDSAFFNKYYSYVEVARKRRNIREDLRRYEQERLLFYHSLEDSMNRMRINGRECLLRTICEAAEVPIEHDGYFGELIHLFLSPKYEDLIENHNDTVYAAARRAGESLYDCKKLYPKCPEGQGLFDVISVLM